MQQTILQLQLQDLLAKFHLHEVFQTTVFASFVQEIPAGELAQTGGGETFRDLLKVGLRAGGLSEGELCGKVQKQH